VIFAFRAENAAFHVRTRISEGPSPMEIDLNFTCCACSGPVAVRVNCSGGSANTTALASVKVPCPECGTILRVAFDTDGTLRNVAALTDYWRVPEPSLN